MILLLQKGLSTSASELVAALDLGTGKLPPKVTKDLRRARAVASAQGLKADRCRWLDEFLNMDL